MLICMRTTLNLNDALMLLLKREAARQGKTMTELVESALHLFLRPRPQSRPLAPLPTFSGHVLVDVANRDELYEAMEGR
jgi:hypothetical protein